MVNDSREEKPLLEVNKNGHFGAIGLEFIVCGIAPPGS